MPVKIELNKNEGNGFKPVKIYTRDIDNEALTQLKKLLNCQLFIRTNQSGFY